MSKEEAVLRFDQQQIAAALFDLSTVADPHAEPTIRICRVAHALGELMGKDPDQTIFEIVEVAFLEFDEI